MTYVQRDGEVLCISCTASDETGYLRLFLPAVDGGRLRALEDEVKEAYVKESFTYTLQDGKTVRCAFVIDCGPSQLPFGGASAWHRSIWSAIVWQEPLSEPLPGSGGRQKKELLSRRLGTVPRCIQTSTH